MQGNPARELIILNIYYQYLRSSIIYFPNNFNVIYEQLKIQFLILDKIEKYEKRLELTLIEKNVVEQFCKGNLTSFDKYIEKTLLLFIEKYLKDEKQQNEPLIQIFFIQLILIRFCNYGKFDIDQYEKYINFSNHSQPLSIFHSISLMEFQFAKSIINKDNSLYSYLFLYPDNIYLIWFLKLAWKLKWIGRVTEERDESFFNSKNIKLPTKRFKLRLDELMGSCLFSLRLNIEMDILRFTIDEQDEIINNEKNNFSSE